MSYIKTSQTRREHIWYSSPMHWIVIAQPILVIAIGCGVLLGMFSTDTLPPSILDLVKEWMLGIPLEKDPFPGATWLVGAAVSATIAGVFSFIRSFIRKSTTEYVLTTRRIVAKWGLVARNTYELSLDRVEGAYVRQTVVGRLLNYGTVFIRGTGGSTVAFVLVRKPITFRMALAEALENRQDERDATTGRHVDDEAP